MPDISQYSPDKAFVPHFFSKVNLSDVFIGSPESPALDTPGDAGGNTKSSNTWDYFLKTTGRNPFANLGIVPAGPGGVDEYSPNQKFTSEAQSYQSGHMHRDLGFLVGRDNEDLFAKNQSNFSKAVNTTVRLFDKVGAYTAQSFGFLGGIVGLGNAHNDYHSGSNFADWIAGASDNALSTWAKDLNDKVDNIYRPIYQDAEDRNKGFFKRLLTDGDFWGGEFVDGAAFLASAYLTGNIGKFLDLGGKAVRGAAALRGLNYADEATALAADGVSGMSEATNLSRAGATVSETGSPLVANTFSPTAGNVVSGVTREAGNFANARKINMGVSTLVNTGSESLFEASNLKDNMMTRLSAEKNADGTPKYTPQEVRDISARAAKNSFILNMIALPISNLWETKMFYGKANPLSARNSANSMIKKESGLLGTAELAKRTFGTKAVDYLKSGLEGVLKEGFWEENIQLAIERINGDEENIDLSFLKNIGKVLNQYGKQTTAVLSGGDKEASMNIGLGGLLGGGMGAHSRYSEIKDLKKNVANFNSQINAFKTTAKDLYEKDDEGNIKLVNGEPVINGANVLSYVASLSKTLNMTELADGLKDKNMPLLHSIVENENFSRLIKAYADNGMIDDLITKLDDYKGYKSEDLMLLGLSNDKEAAAKKIETVKKKAVEYKNIYDNIEKNFFVRMRNDDRYGSKARAMKDKLFYLSTRASHLGTLKDELKTQSEVTSNEIATRYPASETDSIVDKLNELHSAYVSAKKRADQLSNGTLLLNSNRELDDSTSDEVVSENSGNRITRPRKKRSAQTQPDYQAVDEADLEEAVTNAAKLEKELADFITENKDTIKNVKRGADGRFRYESSEKNRLTYDTGVARNQVIANDIEQARNATLNVFNRISDIRFGEKYFDQVYSKRKQDFVEQVGNDEGEDLEENIHDPEDTPPGGGSDRLGLPDSTSPESRRSYATNFTSRKETMDEMERLKTEKEALESQDEISLEDEVRIDELNKKLEDLEELMDNVDESMVGDTIDFSNNIVLTDKEEYKHILLDIEKNKRRIRKTDEYYEIDGERYKKVSEVIGNIVPDDIRPLVQNGLTAGYTVDSIVKAFFDNELNDDFRQSIGQKISDEAYDKLIKELDNIKAKLRAEGIEVVATNVPVFDPVLKVAGEIDILAVDKKGNFKIYEIEARQSRIWSMIATKQGRGPAIYEMTQKQLSAYRNLFSNQYGQLPGTISVMFPIAVKYDKADQSGFIEKVELKKEIRYTPTGVVGIKSTVFQPVRVGSKYDGYDMTSLFIRSFIPASMDIAKGKLRFLLRNVSFDKIKAGVVMTVKEAESGFQERYNNQQRFLNGENVAGFKLTQHGDLNLYSLSGNKEISLMYEGELLGYMSPSPALAYKLPDGTFKVLDENVSEEDYKNATGNSPATFSEFKNISRAYKSAYADLVNRIQPGKEAFLTNKEVQELFDVTMSYGELDLVNVGQARPDLGGLAVNGVKVNTKKVITIVNVDDTDSVKVIMEKKGRSKNSGKRYQEIDVWANKNLNSIKAVMNNKRGERVTDYVAIIETPDGKLHPIALRLKKDQSVNLKEDFVTDLGTKFSASTSVNVFKNESVSLIPRKSTVEADIKLKGTTVIGEVYSGEDIEKLEQFGMDVSEIAETTDTVINDFLNNLSTEDFSKINTMFAAFPMTKEELFSEILDDYNSGTWSSAQDYIEQLKCDL